MLEKNSPASTSYSFEQLLGWFGRFTPQFKFRLMSMRRHMDAATFDGFIKETLGVFRALMIELSRTPKGPERARKSFMMIEEEYRATPVTGVSCAAGCGACCRSFVKQITDDEADLLVSLIVSGEATIDLELLAHQSQSLKSTDPIVRQKAEKSPCPFLDAENRCSVYADRPGVCRKYYVTSPQSHCSSDDHDVVPKIDIMPELIVSAAMSLPDNGIDIMQIQIAKRLGLD